MDEQTWLVSANQEPMLEFMLEGREAQYGTWRPDTATNRKLRLFACACCRQAWSGLTDRRCRQAVEWGERYADGEVSEDARRTAFDGLPQPSEMNFNQAQLVLNCVFPDGWDQWHAVSELAANGWGVLRATQADILRDIFGNPFRPLQIDRDRLDENGTCCYCEGGYRLYCKRCRGTYDTCGNKFCPMCPESLGEFRKCEACCGLAHTITETVVRLAQSIYDNRDWAAMPALADAIEEAGCREEALVRHLRGEETCWCCRASFPAGSGDLCSVCCPGKETLGKATGWAPLRGEHVRGCWALDLILGKV